MGGEWGDSGRYVASYPTNDRLQSPTIDLHALHQKPSRSYIVCDEVKMFVCCEIAQLQITTTVGVYI